MALKVLVDTSYHQFVLAPLEVFAVVGIAPPEQLVGLTESADALVVGVGVGVRDGRVEVTLTSDPAEAWGPVEDEAEVVMTIAEELLITSPTVENDLDAVFTPAQPGPHHVRVRGRGPAAPLRPLGRRKEAGRVVPDRLLVRLVTNSRCHRGLL